MIVQESIAVVGLGYVGLPLAVAFAKHFDRVVGFDIDEKRVAALQAGEDWTGEVTMACRNKKTFSRNSRSAIAC